MRRGLTIVLSGADPDRTASALRIAAAEAALGGRVRLFFDVAAVPALACPDPLIATAMDLGAQIIACQTGLSEHQLGAERLDPAIETGGLVSLLADLDNDRLVIA